MVLVEMVLELVATKVHARVINTSSILKHVRLDRASTSSLAKCSHDQLRQARRQHLSSHFPQTTLTYFFSDRDQNSQDTLSTRLQ